MKRWNDPYGILSLKTTTAQEITLLFALSTFVNSETLEAYPSNKSLCDLTKLHRNTIIKLKKSLVSKKIITISRKTKNNIDVILFLTNKENGVLKEGDLHTTSATDENGLAHLECTTCTSGVQTCTCGVQTCTSGGTEHLLTNINNQVKNQSKFFTNQKEEFSMKGKSVYGKGKSVHDVVAGMKFTKPKKWTSSQLIISWNNYYAEEFPDIVAPIHSVAEQNYFKLQANKVGFEKVGYVIPRIISEWSFFAAERKSEGVSYVPNTPNLKFFTKYLPEACNFIDSLDKTETVKPTPSNSNIDKNIFCVPVDDNGYAEWVEGDYTFTRKGGSYYRTLGSNKFWFPVSKINSVEEFMNIYKCKTLPIDAFEDFNK